MKCYALVVPRYLPSGSAPLISLWWSYLLKIAQYESFYLSFYHYSFINQV